MSRHFLVLLAFAAPLFAQAPHEHWKTVATKHFRVHYPSRYEAWSLQAASRIESIRDAVVREVGYAPETVTDVIVMNPVADANGVTIPLLGHPRILLFTEPPEPEVGTGEFSEWMNILTVHEMTHLVHLLRPSRSPMQQFIEHLLPLDPITLHGPRWVLEGYATVIEGRITGAGRPNSSIRAAILRQWAASGRLPTYPQLSSDHHFLGMSMAYLAGSAYLEWLEKRVGPDSLKHLWARMTARQKRSFDTAFEGVFGDSPERLYGLFTAELTQRAVALNGDARLQDGELWLDTKRGSGDPAISPDGSQIALVDRGEGDQSKLAVYSTGINEEEKKFNERAAKILKRDPEDVAPVRSKPLPRKAKHTLMPRDGGDVFTPRWAGSSILYTHKQPDGDGVLHHDLFLWNPVTGENRRLTHLADVKDADPLPGGRQAIGVRNRFGFSQLVKVDLATGAISDYTEPALDRIVSHPRASVSHVAWSEHDASGWHVVVDGVRKSDGYEPEWGRDGALYTTVAGGGFIDIERNGEPVTHSAGAAFQPAPSSNGSLYFMSLDPDGFVVRKLVPARLAPRSVDGFVPPLPPSNPVVFQTATTVAPRDYGLGRQERGFLLGGRWTAYDHSNELGVRFGDVVGRLDTIARLATGPERGFAIASTWRGWPIALTAHAYRLSSGDAEGGQVCGQPSGWPAKGLAPHMLRRPRGIELRAEHEYHAPMFTTQLEAGASSRAFAIGTVSLHQRHTRERIRIAADSGHHVRGTIGASMKFGEATFALTGEAGRNLSVGGFASSVVPDSLRVQRVDDPALPPGFASATRYRSARADLAIGEASLFWQRYNVGNTIDVRGVALNVSVPPVPLVKTAGLDLSGGVAKVTGLRGIKGWLALRWRP